MPQLTIYGKVQAGNCVFCGRKITDISSDEYLKNPREIYRCAECEIEFSKTVFDLKDDVVEMLKEKWIK